MSHEFTLGQTVVFTPNRDEILSSVTSGKVTRLLPKEDVEYQYHIEVGPEGQQRRVQENQLRPSAEVAARWPT